MLRFIKTVAAMSLITLAGNSIAAPILTDDQLQAAKDSIQHKTQSLNDIGRGEFIKQKANDNLLNDDGKIDFERVEAETKRLLKHSDKGTGFKQLPDTGVGDGKSGMGIPISPQTERWMKMRTAMGIKEWQELYVFVSLSMPESLLRQYQLEAAKSGAALVVRGIPKGMTLQGYIQSRIKPMLGVGGVQAPMQIDPRLFDRYQVKTVPTIVLADVATVDMNCTNTTCDHAAKDSYSSVKGNVSLWWALDQFARKGVDTTAFVSRYKAPDDGIPQEAKGMAPDSFDAAIRQVGEESARMLAREFDEGGWGAYTQLYKTPFGSAIGPRGLNTDGLNKKEDGK